MIASENLDVEGCLGTDSLDGKMGDDGKPPLDVESPSRRISSLILSILGQPEGSSATVQKLVECLSELSPEEVSELAGSLQVQHYLHRLVQHALKHNRHEEIVGKLAEYFPGKIKDYRERELSISYSYSDVEPQTSKQLRRVTFHDTTTTTTTAQRQSAEIFQYNPNKLAATFRACPMTLESVRKASDAVVSEVSKFEKSMSSNNTSPAKRSVSVGWHGMMQAVPRFRDSIALRRQSHSKPSPEKAELLPVMSSEIDDPHYIVSKSRNSLFPQKHREPLLPLQTSPIMVNGLPLRTAFDVIEAFASGQLRAESESVYLNYTHPDRCSPYDLSVTLRTKAMPEHFVISNFGIIHVYPDGMSDFQTFAEWLREASMFTLMRQIPFFREYKLKHAFQQWHRAVKSAKLHRLALKINKICIRFFPIYADALLKLRHLSEELLSISFHHLKPLGGYTLDAMEHSLQGSQTKAKQFLLKYFKYCRRIVCTAIEASKKHASDLESEHRHQPLVPEVPLSTQRKRHKKLEKDLEAAVYQRERIGDFVHLAEQLVYYCLMQLARDGADSWKEVFLSPINRQASSGFQIRVREKEKVDGGSKQPDILKQGDYFLLSSLVVDASGNSRV